MCSRAGDMAMLSFMLQYSQDSSEDNSKAGDRRAIIHLERSDQPTAMCGPEAPSWTHRSDAPQRFNTHSNGLACLSTFATYPSFDHAQNGMGPHEKSHAPPCIAALSLRYLQNLPINTQSVANASAGDRSIDLQLQSKSICNSRKNRVREHAGGRSMCAHPWPLEL